MACRAYFLALDEPCIARLLAADGSDQRVIEVIKDLDMTGALDECGADKTSDGIHRRLTDDKLGSKDGTYPLNPVVLGGLPLHQGETTSSATTPRLRSAGSPHSPHSTLRRSSSDTGHSARTTTTPRSTNTSWST